MDLTCCNNKIWRKVNMCYNLNRSTVIFKHWANFFSTLLLSLHSSFSLFFFLVVLFPSIIWLNYLHLFPFNLESWRMVTGQYGLTGEVSEGSSNLNIVFLTKWYPKLSKFRGFNERVECERGTPIIRYIASKLVSWKINCQQREHGVHCDDSWF